MSYDDSTVKAAPVSRGNSRTVKFGTKAQTLSRLSGKLDSARILPIHSFEVAAWQKDQGAVCKGFAQLAWASGPVIVRSSAIGEDAEGASQAGRFISILNVAGIDSFVEAVEAVIRSYGRDGRSLVPGDEVLVQPMLDGVSASGVAFSRDPNTGSPYLVINYSTGSDTTSVTGGTSGDLQTLYVARGSDTSEIGKLAKLEPLAAELESLLGTDCLDIEFAFDSTDHLYLLQVRSLAVRQSTQATVAEHAMLLDSIANKVETGMRPHPYLRGKRTIYGVMPDWNPAEIVGIRPRPLALSLYRDLITNSIWAYQRNNYGYRNLRSFPLLLSFHGLPYIDVRVSFNSFVPADLDDRLADQLVNVYLDQLVNAPSLHDKVEFSIVFSCYTVDLPDRIRSLGQHGFSQADIDAIVQSLKNLTNRVINRHSGLWRQDAARIEELRKRRIAIHEGGLDKISRIYWLIEDCKRYGTLPFAGLARAGFIAVQFLNSFVSVGILTQAERDGFISNLDTISAQMARDYRTMEMDAFLGRYGHLRPGTYDILSPRYDEEPGRYFDRAASAGAGKATIDAHKVGFALTLEKMRGVEKLLQEHGLESDVVGVFDFLEAGINGREYSKFVFTQSLSDILKLIADLGQQHGFSTDDMSYVQIADILGLYVDSANVAETLKRSIENGRRLYEETKQIVLPPLITTPADVWSFHMPATEPNFITQKSVSGPIRRVDESTDLEGSIVLIPSADPGFDWLFTRNIKGFITAYGGVNSHMAVRANELGMPAVVGAGQTLFDAWRAARMLEVDCGNRLVRILQ